MSQKQNLKLVSNTLSSLYIMDNQSIIKDIESIELKLKSLKTKFKSSAPTNTGYKKRGRFVIIESPKKTRKLYPSPLHMKDEKKGGRRKTNKKSNRRKSKKKRN